MSPASRKAAREAARKATRLIRRALPAARRALPMARRALPAAVALLVVAVSLTIMAASRPAAARSGADGWITSWSASPQEPGPGSLAAHGFDDQTVREIIFASAGGNPIRLELTNLFGITPLHVGRVTVAEADPRVPGSAMTQGQVHPVTFGGGTSVVIPAGGQLLSDPVAMRVDALENLAVSVYLPDRTGPATFHSDGQQLTWMSRGDHAADPGAAAFTTSTLSWYYASSLVVRSADMAGTVVAFGDSITDGAGSTVGADARWPNDLARRLDELGGPALSVADEGIGGNRLLGGSVCCGVPAGSRFARDAMDRPGVRDVIVLEGINDIGVGMAHPAEEQGVSTARIIATYQRLIAEAHARGLKIFGATLLPYQGAGYFTAAGATIREQVNEWIRTSRAFDGVIDFDAVMSDPANPLRLNPIYDSGDHLHPNDAGYQAMADAINLPMLFPRA
jgi:lysophospholipase L1-like esterase